MYLIGHAALGITLASQVHSPILAFGIGWFSHYLGDFFPHGDEIIGVWAKKGNEVQRIMIIAGIDGLLFLVTYGFFIKVHGFSLVSFAAAIGSFVPDVMWGTEKLFHRPIFGVLQRFHQRNHNFFGYHLPTWVGFVLQGMVVIPLWWYLMK